jgi:hypothetical protein
MTTSRKTRGKKLHVKMLTVDGVSGIWFDDPDAPSGQSRLLARISSGHLDEPENGLVAEMMSGRAPVPWASVKTREAHLALLTEATWIEDGLKARILEYVQKTPAYDYEEEPVEGRLVLYSFMTHAAIALVSFEDERFAAGKIYVAARTAFGNYPDDPDSVLSEMRTGKSPLPFQSEKTRQEAMREVRESREFNQETREHLLAHIQRAPVYEQGD